MQLRGRGQGELLGDGDSRSLEPRVHPASVYNINGHMQLKLDRDTI
jgi:hypothetical protein